MTLERTAISHVRYVALAVEDFAPERRFLQEQWLLDEVAGGDGTAYFAARGSDEAFVLRLRAGEDRRADLFALAVGTRADVDALHRDLVAREVVIDREPGELASHGGGYGFRFFDLDGRLVEISADVAPRVVDMPAPRSAVPHGLSHAVFHTPDVRKTVAWYEEFLGLRVSDWIDGFMCFMRGNGRKHHIMAFLLGPPALNHVAFEMANADEMMRGLGRMLRNDITLTWGPGRHTLGDNTFSYFRTPAGNMFEYTAEIETIPDGWVPRVLPRTPETLDQWGTGRVSGPATYPPMQPDPALWQSAPF